MTALFASMACVRVTVVTQLRVCKVTCVVELFERGEKRVEKLTSVLLSIVVRDPVEQRVSLAMNECPDCVDDVGRVRAGWDGDGVLPKESTEVVVKALSDGRSTSLFVLTRQFLAA